MSERKPGRVTKSRPFKVPKDERTLQRVDKVSAKIGRAELGTPSKITRATRPAPAAAPAIDPAEALKRAFLATLNTPLRAKSGLPTLAERIVKEGVAAQLGRGPKETLEAGRRRRGAGPPARPTKGKKR